MAVQASAKGVVLASTSRAATTPLQGQTTHAHFLRLLHLQPRQTPVTPLAPRVVVVPARLFRLPVEIDCQRFAMRFLLRDVIACFLLVDLTWGVCSVVGHRTFGVFPIEGHAPNHRVQKFVQQCSAAARPST